MLNVIFRKMERSEIAEQIVNHRLESVLDGWLHGEDARVIVTLSTINSRTQAGQDEYAVKVRVIEPKQPLVVIEKRAANLYVALSEVCETLRGKLKRRKERAIRRRLRARSA